MHGVRASAKTCCSRSDGRLAAPAGRAQQVPAPGSPVPVSALLARCGGETASASGGGGR